MGHREHETPQAEATPCPGCGAAAGALVDSLPTADLAELYRRRGIEVSAYFETTALIRRFRCQACDLGYFSPPCPGDGPFYEQLQTQSWYYQDEKPEYDYAARFIQAGQRVLEVGCGKGAFHAWLPSKVSYRGLEFNMEAVQKAQAAGLDVRKQSIEEHATRHPAAYDRVCSFQVLEHVPEPASFVHACVDALAPGGLLIIAVPAEDSFLAVAANAPLNMPPHHVLRWSDRALRNLANREGLVLKDLWHEPIAPFHRDWQLQALAHHYLARRRARLIDHSLRYRLAARLLQRQSIRDWLAQRAVRASPDLERGHTVILVAEKPALT
ncbi:bifunctional 2-polyprenyl-6-hydroxyphenol methylase/3-demethylubiquinol 3-O-methyltransferase UbiG [Massilia sp. 9I]|uniref:class I SAM-dependent methyltransferase n=1 Tax=Massilia sp. 9I TaxID=2653152 RepID=UPI0012F121FB|nr:class I SAM-dependent methyltransferase [Massilia sp. 9I]VXC51963.1 Methyltransferase type 12 [Massilia sp. 9I]